MFNLAEKAWNSITARTIQKCWYRGLAGAFSGEGNESDRYVASNQIEANTDVEHCEELFRMMGIEDKHEWIHIDDDCLTYEYLTNHDVVTSVLNVCTNEHATDVYHIEEDDDLPPPLPKLCDAIAVIDTPLQWLECQNVDKIHILHLKEIREIARKKNRQALKQSTLESFLVHMSCFWYTSHCHGDIPSWS